MTEIERTRGAGGTPGGVLEFVIGMTMAFAGAYLLTSQVEVSTGFWRVGGYNSFGLTLIPLLVGIGMLFFKGRSPLGWLLVVLGAGIIFVGIISNLHIYFRPTSLFNTIMMLGMLAGGLGLVARGIRVH